nr:hypothetical protein [Tanacetum cinerariifolium]
MKANDAIPKNMQINMTSLINSNLELKNMFGQFMKMNTVSSSGSGTLPVERETEATKDTVHPTNNGSTKGLIAAPVSAPKPNQKPSIPYPSRVHDQKLRDKANDQRENFFQIFKDLNFNISFADALILMLKFGPTIKTLLKNKDKMSDWTLRHPDTINAAAGGPFMKRRPEECYYLIRNMTAPHNDWDTSAQRSKSSSSITSFSNTKTTALKAEMADINKNLMRVLQVNQQVKAVTPNCETYGGPHSFNDCQATIGQTQNVYAAGHNPQGKGETSSSKELAMVKTHLQLIKLWFTMLQFINPRFLNLKL